MGEIKSMADLKIDRYPVRTCRTLHECEACGGSITIGQRYRDGGYGRRFHEDTRDCPWLRASRAGKGESDG